MTSEKERRKLPQQNRTGIQMGLEENKYYSD